MKISAKVTGQFLVADCIRQSQEYTTRHIGERPAWMRLWRPQTRSRWKPQIASISTRCY